jgi:hypothetical protein
MLKRFQFFGYILLLGSLSGCFNEDSLVPVPPPPIPPGGGGTISRPLPSPAKPVPLPLPSPTTKNSPMPMIDDPDSKTVEYDEQVFGDSESQARQRCEELAAKYTRRGGKLVTAVSVKQVKGKLYVCKLRGEIDG